MTTAPVRVGTFAAYFRIAPTPRSWGRLERVRKEWGERPFMEHPWPDDAQVEVRVTVFEADGRLFVGAVETRTVPVAFETGYGAVPPPAVASLPVDTNIHRALPLGRLAQEAIADVRDPNVASMELADDDAARLRLARAAETQGRRGRPTPLTPEVLTLVARTYQSAGRTGVKAVQDALQRAGFPGAAADGVTRDQAAKAVATARRKGYLPQAGRRRHVADNG